MRKVFLDDLPRRGKVIDWINSVGNSVDFVYDEVKGSIFIENYQKSRQMLTASWNEKGLDIRTDHFSNGNLGKLLGIINGEYKYNTNDVVIVNTGGVKILKQTRVNNHKTYRYRCLNCNHIDIKTEYQMLKKSGCPVCTNLVIKKGVNDMWTTNPELASLLKHPEVGYTLSEKTGRADWVCPDCGNIIKNKRIDHVRNHGVMCPKCSDGVSYPEKFMFCVLEQLNYEFQTQLTSTTFEWCRDYRYDFYIPEMNCIVETHGEQHYKKKGFKGLDNLKKIQENDKIKMELAIYNGINRYIIIDCLISDLDYIKTSILNSQLGEFADLSKVDWLKCHQYACSSRIRQASDLWNLGNNTSIISKIMKISQNTTIKYLKQASNLKLCKYDSQQNMQSTQFKKRKVICLTTEIVYEGASDVKKLLDIRIDECLGGRAKSAGKHPKTGEKLRWMYYDDYIEQQNQNIKQIS